MDTVDPSGAATGPQDPGGSTGGEASGTSKRSLDLRATLEAIVSEAERVSEELVDESRATAAATTRVAEERAAEILDQARAVADVIRSRAESDVEEYRRRVRVEVVEQVRAELGEQNRRELAEVRAQSQAVIGDLEASVRILGVSMESAVANIAEMLSALEQLRSHHVDPVPQARSVASPTPLDASTEPHEILADPLGHPAGEPSFGEPSFGEPEPPASAAQTSASDGAADTERPMTASEAFLHASSFEAQAAGAAEQREGASNNGTTDSAPDPDAEPTKPLGWLFRSSD